MWRPVVPPFGANSAVRDEHLVRNAAHLGIGHQRGHLDAWRRRDRRELRLLRVRGRKSEEKSQGDKPNQPAHDCLP